MVQSIGIDVSKGKLDVGLINLDQTTSNLQCGNDHHSIPSLVKALQSCQDVRDIPIVIEATGGYHYGITFALIEKGFKKVFVINPIITKKHLSSQIRKVKTDKKDSLLLAKIGLLEDLHVYTESKEEVLFKRDIRLLHFLKKQLQQVNNRLSSAKSLNIENDFEQEMLLETKKKFEIQLKKIKQKILKSVKVEAPMIRGLSELHLKAITVELGNINRFKNHKQIVAYAGLDPSIRESGSSVRGKSKLSKRGSKTMRYFLFQSAWGVMMHNNKYKEYYSKKRAEGKHYYTCLSAIARKLLCEIYHNLKECPYSIN